MVTMAIPSVQWSTPDCQPRPVWDKRFDSKPVWYDPLYIPDVLYTGGD